MDIKYILIILSLLIIFSYLFDEIARKTKFPSVILLMVTGILARAVSDYVGVHVMYLDKIIPVMGTIGLILIVLEGALELDVNKEKVPIIIKGFLAAFVILMLNIIGLSYVFMHWLDLPKEVAITNAIPLSIISSAVAIPSASALLPINKEFIVYESTFSDILGIMVFNYSLKQFTTGQELLGFTPVFVLLLEIGGIIIASMLVTFLLFELMERITHNVKFFLILAILILLYTIGKKFHLPSLVFIFVFGLVMSNAKTMLPNFLKRYVNMGVTGKQGLHEFHILTAESTFIVRTFFFLFFGFSIPLSSFVDGYNYMYGGVILAIMFAMRLLYMLINERKNIGSLLFISPRGLITILLFLQLQTGGDYEMFKSAIINEKVLLIVILGSMLLMLIGTLGFARGKSTTLSEAETHTEDSGGEGQIGEADIT